MHCTVFIENLLLSQMPEREPYAGLRLPALETLLARGTLTTHEPVETAAWLCRSFGITQQQDWPTAPLLALADGLSPAGQFWLHADPVHVQANRSQLVLAQTITDLTAAEAAALITTLNQHFAQDGLVFHAPQPDRWYLALTQTPQLGTTPLTMALQRSIDPHLPRGTDALVWHRHLNEAQMILHSHPVNEAREVRGMLPVNSLWLSGGGVLPPVTAQEFNRVWTTLANPLSDSQRLAQALAGAAGIDYTAAAALPVLLRESSTARPLLLLDTLLEESDVATWHTRLIALDRDWMAPLLTALAARRIEGIRLICGNEARTLELNIIPSQVRRWWQRPRPLIQYLQDTRA